MHAELREHRYFRCNLERTTHDAGILILKSISTPALSAQDQTGPERSVK